MKGRFLKLPYLIGLGGVILLSVLVYRYFAPFGKEVKYSFNQNLPNSQKNLNLPPSKDSAHYQSLLINNPVTRFSISNFDLSKADTVNINFKFKSGQKEIKLGLSGQNQGQYLYFPLYQANLVGLTWPSFSDRGLTLYQKTQKYDSFSQFVTNPPEDASTATYFVNPDDLFTYETASSQKGNTSIKVPLRQEHTFLIKVTQGPLDIKVSKQDYNLYPGPDKFKMALFHQDQLIAEKIIEDDGVTDASNIQTLPQEGEILIDQLDPGIYTLKLGFMGEYSGDGQINQIDINQKSVVIPGYIFAVGQKPVTIYSNSSKITASTSHAGSVQDLSLNGKIKIPIKKASVSYNFDISKLDPSSKVYYLTAPKSDISFTSSGFFSFSPDSFFLPYYTETTDLKNYPEVTDIQKNLDYIISSAPAIVSHDGWLETSLTVPVKKIANSDGNLYFSLEIPELDKHGGSLEISGLDIVINDRPITPTEVIPTNVPTETPIIALTPTITTVHQPGLWQKIKNLFSRPFSSSLVTTPTPIATPSPVGFCLLNDQNLAVGSTFTAADGCNYCTCTSTLQVECTSNSCSQN